MEHTMGNVLGGTVTKMMAERAVDMLQEREGLGQLSSEKFGLGKWNSKTTFGYDFSRNQAFKVLVDSLKKPLKEGLKQAGVKPVDITGYQENYIQTYLVNHIMRCLLASGEDMPEFQASGLAEESFLKQPKLPEYSKESIDQFRNQWLQLNEEVAISIDTTDDSEQALLSAKLANSVIMVIENINITQCVSLAVKAHGSQQTQTADNRNRLFNQAGNPSLQANRQAYTREQQATDLEAQVRSDLGPGNK